MIPPYQLGPLVLPLLFATLLLIAAAQASHPPDWRGPAFGSFAAKSNAVDWGAVAWEMP